MSKMADERYPNGVPDGETKARHTGDNIATNQE